MSVPDALPDPLHLSFGFRFVTLARHWRRLIEVELAQSGLTDASWSPLVHLDTDGDDITQSELAQRIGLDGSSLVRLLDILESRSLIARRVDPQDRRARRIILTEAGRREVQKIRADLQKIEIGFLHDLSETELAQMMAGFSKIETRLRDLAKTQVEK